MHNLPRHYISLQAQVRVVIRIPQRPILTPCLVHLKLKHVQDQQTQKTYPGISKRSPSCMTKQFGSSTSGHAMVAQAVLQGKVGACLQLCKRFGVVAGVHRCQGRIVLGGAGDELCLPGLQLAQEFGRPPRPYLTCTAEHCKSAHCAAGCMDGAVVVATSMPNGCARVVLKG